MVYHGQATMAGAAVHWSWPRGAFRGADRNTDAWEGGGVIRLLTTEEIGGRRRRSAANSERQRWKFGAHPHGVLNRWECDWLLESMRGSPHELF
jgi:hypothetical protein